MNNVVATEANDAGKNESGQSGLLKLSQNQLDKLMAFIDSQDTKKGFFECTFQNLNHVAGITCLQSAKVDQNV